MIMPEKVIVTNKRKTNKEDGFIKIFLVYSPPYFKFLLSRLTIYSDA